MKEKDFQKKLDNIDDSLWLYGGGHLSPTSPRSSNYLVPPLVIGFTGARNVKLLGKPWCSRS